MINDIPKKFPFETEPFEHQRRVFEETWNRPFYAILWEMGMGKTKLLIDTAAAMYMIGQIDGLLIVAPKGVYLTWVYNEIPKHMPQCVDYYIGFWSSHLKKKDKRSLEAVIQRNHEDGLDIMVINTEALSSKRGTEAAMRFLKNHPAMSCIDESTAIKNPKAKRTKAAMRIANESVARRIMTGSPITQSPFDLYSQTNFLKKAVLGFTSYFAFKNYFGIIQQMRMGTRTFPQVVGFRNLQELTDKLQPFSSRLTKKECLDLPDKIYSTRYVELSPEQERVYKEIVEVAVTELSGSVITITSVLTAIVKLQQVVCGHLKDEEGETHDIANGRMSALAEIIEEMSGKAIIWCNFVRDVELIRDYLAEKFGDDSMALYYGPINDEDRANGIRRFQDDSECRFFVGTGATGGKGITLTAANTVIYYSNSYNLETRLQTEDRAHRIGQRNAVNYIDLIAKGTIDEKIVTALKNKTALASEVLDNWEEYIC